ncbi:MAG: collagen-like protein [Bacteroidota bacterium]|jgi:hypothetical protein|nr:hypothetical protein [Prolixibacteraceae bacterium]MDI9564233.1 collagen-like protein [Bacteroidota bacterium]NLS99475.1 collagen-like protein [Bacteroidales bacterium]HNZ68656.1 hypothetical protein [Prolixibacteraceae bacterium]HOC87008.1 hypothetical protein [Prolixibacteraceae bacterium]
MKTIKALFLGAVMILLAACEGIPGRDGIDGIDGKDGVNILGSAFEIEGDFTEDNDWMLYFKFPNTLKVYESDIVLVYILWEQTAVGGKDLDVWRLLPQTIILDEGILQYNYDFTMVDVQIFLSGTIAFNTLLPAESQNQVFRIVVMPADFAMDFSLDLTDYNMVMKSLNLQDARVPKVNFPDIEKSPVPVL